MITQKILIAISKIFAIIRVFLTGRERQFLFERPVWAERKIWKE
jgi:hypothetical protein